MEEMTATATAQNAPLVSVIVATYNYGHFIVQTLKSLQAQTYPYWECLVVDDGSTDETRSVVARCAEADKRIRHINQDNARQAAARNNGLRRCRGTPFGIFPIV